jgi:hypothetical protein
MINVPNAQIGSSHISVPLTRKVELKGRRELIMTATASNAKGGAHAIQTTK